MPLSVGTRLAHYNVTALLGEGGMARSGRLPTPSSTARGRIPDFPEQCVGKDGL